MRWNSILNFRWILIIIIRHYTVSFCSLCLKINFSLELSNWQRRNFHQILLSSIWLLVVKLLSNESRIIMAILIIVWKRCRINTDEEIMLRFKKTILLFESNSLFNINYLCILNTISVLYLYYLGSSIWIHHCKAFIAINLVHLQAFMKISEIIPSTHKPTWPLTSFHILTSNPFWQFAETWLEQAVFI